MSSTTSPQFSQSQTPPPPPPIATPAFHNFLSNITESVHNNLGQRGPWSELVDPSHTAWVTLAWVSLIFRVYFLIFGFGFSIRSIFILDFVLKFFGTLEVWEKRVGEELGLGFQTLENICTVNVADVNRVLETQFTGGHHVEKVPTQTRSKHENRPSKTWFIVQNWAS